MKVGDYFQISFSELSEMPRTPKADTLEKHTADARRRILDGKESIVYVVKIVQIARRSAIVEDK